MTRQYCVKGAHRVWRLKTISFFGGTSQNPLSLKPTTHAPSGPKFEKNTKSISLELPKLPFMVSRAAIPEIKKWLAGNCKLLVKTKTRFYELGKGSPLKARPPRITQSPLPFSSQKYKFFMFSYCSPIAVLLARRGPHREGPERTGQVRINRREIQGTPKSGWRSGLLVRFHQHWEEGKSWQYQI